MGSAQEGGWIKANLVNFKPHGKGMMRHKDSPSNGGKFLLFKVDMDNGRYKTPPELLGEDKDQSVMHIPSINDFRADKQ